LRPYHGARLKGKVTPARPTTAIPEFDEGHLSEQQYRAVVEIVDFASRLQEADLNPSGGPTLHWRVEVAAAFLAAMIDHAKLASEAFSKEEGHHDIVGHHREAAPGVGYCLQKDGACWYSADQREYHGGDKRVVDIDDGYLAAQGPIVRERLKKAAVRLAAILNVALTPGF
jgi:hypothetical protein